MADIQIDAQQAQQQQEEPQHSPLLQQDNNSNNNTLNNIKEQLTEEKEVQKEEQEEVTIEGDRRIKIKMIQSGNAEKEEQKEEAKEEEEEDEDEDGNHQKDEAKEDLHPPCTVVMIVPTPHGVTSSKVQPLQQPQLQEDEEEEEARGQLRRESTTPTTATTPTTTTSTTPGRMLLSSEGVRTAGPSAFSHFKDLNNSSKRSQLMPIPREETDYLNKINNNHNNAFDNTLTPTITLQTGPSPASLLQATLSASQQQHPQHAQHSQQSQQSAGMGNNKDLWLEVSMHAHIVSNLAAMAQGQRLSSPPLEMIRSHLNHINNKVKELGYLYPQSSTTPPSLSPPSSGSVPFSYPPGMTQPLNGWGSDSSDEYRPDLRSSNSKVSNFASAQPGWFNNMHNTYNNTHNTLTTRSSSFSSPPSASSSSYGLPSASSASAPSTPHNSGSPPLTSPSSPSTTPSSPLRDSIDESAAAILSSSRFSLALSPTPSPSSTSGGVVRPMGGSHSQFHHYSASLPPSGRYPNSGVAPIHRPIKFSPHRIPGSLQSAAELQGHRSAFTATSAHADVSLPQAAAAVSPGRSSAVSTKNNNNSSSAAATALKKRKRPAPSCDQCHTMYTPEWRRGPRGAGTLCNACGLRYSRQEKRLKKREEHLETKKKASIDAILNP